MAGDVLGTIRCPMGAVVTTNEDGTFTIDRTNQCPKTGPVSRLAIPKKTLEMLCEEHKVVRMNETYWIGEVKP